MQSDTASTHTEDQADVCTPVANLIPRRILGRTGSEVSILGLGGGGLFFDEKKRDEAVVIINRAIDLGINYLDTAPSYGASEDLYGLVVQNRRDEVFLATKCHERTYDEAWQSLERSFERLRTNRVDLIQVHNIESRDAVDQVMAKDGAIQAMLEFRSQNLVQWIGVTGHRDPDPLRYALERFDFDTVLCPVNIADRHYLSFIDNLLPMAEERNLGRIGMKIYCAGGVFSTLRISPSEALRYALSQSISTGIVGVENLQHLLQNIDIARSFRPMTAQQQTVLLSHTRDSAAACSSKFKRNPA